MKQIGIQMYSVREYMKTKEDLERTLGTLASFGLRSVQITPPAFLTVTELKAMLDRYGLQADSVIRSTGNVIPTIEEAKRDAEILGTDVLRTDSIPPELRTSADGYRRFAERMNAEGNACRRAGLRYMYHFHSFEWISFGKERGIDILLNETDPAAVFFQPDVFWLTNAGTEPSSSLKLFRGRAFSIHVKDYAIRQLEGKIENVPFFYAPVGTGNLNWEGIMKTAEEIGIGRYVIEQDACEGNVFDAVKTSVLSLHAMGIGF